MEDSGCSVTISSLTCQEDQIVLDDGDEIEYIKHQESGFSDSEDEYIEILLSRESNSERRFCGTISYCDDNWLRVARSDAVQWIKKNMASFGFSPQTAYLAVTYLDRFLIRRSIDKERPWAFRLLSVACLSLAAKMEECVVPPLLEYQIEECKFDSNTVQRMELLILSTLDWRMSSATPFAYLNYFTSKLQIGSNKSKELVSKSTGFIFAIIEDVNLVDCWPSTIAAAAVLAAFDQRLTKKSVESKLRIFSSCGTLESEHVFSCYATMTRESQTELPASNSFVSSESSVYCSDADDSTSFSTRSSKRRRVESAHNY